MSIDEAIDSILSGNCILFTGAGYSFGATNIKNDSPKNGGKLTSFLYSECDIAENDYDLKNASQIYQETHTESKLIGLLRHEFTIKDVSDEHRIIASLPWKRIYTTNYDNALELSFSKEGKLLTAVTLSDKINQYLDKRTFCVHLNGYIERLTPATLRSEFKLTNSSYLTTDFMKSAWVDLFRHDIQNAKVVLFIGFSCDGDLDISRIISEYTTKKNIFFIVRKGESPLSIRKLQRYGNVLDIELKGIASLIQQRQAKYIPSEITFQEPRSFTKYSNDYSVPKKQDNKIVDLFYKGIIDESLIHYSLMDSDKYMYYIKRRQIESVIDYINNGGRNILLHSDLGNGKTLFVHGLADDLIKSEYEVYFWKKNYPNTHDEIELLCRKESKLAIIIENYSQNIDLLKRINLFRTNETIVVVTERSITNDTNYVSLEKYLFSDSYLTKDLNVLDDDEIGQVIKLANVYGLWGENAGLSDERKRTIFINKYHSSFRLFLLSLLDSPDIKHRFNDLLLSIKEANESFFHATLLILSSSLFDFNLDFDDLLNILDDELLENPAFYNNDKLLEIIDFKEHKFLVRSSILAESLLVKNKYHDELIDLLIAVVKKLDVRLYDKNSYQIIKSIVSFSRLQGIFNLNENPAYKPVILSFFEEIKSTNYAKKNPYFWLQYAIAKLSIRDYPIAKKFFDTSYGYAKNDSNFDTFQIDNHYARYLIENENINGSINSCMDVFIHVHGILSNRNDANANRHYPFRVAINYGRFYDAYYSKLEKADQGIFIISCKEIMARIEQYKKVTNERNIHKSVTKCQEEMERIFIAENISLLS